MGLKLVLGVTASLLVAWITLKWTLRNGQEFVPDTHILRKNVIVTGASSGIGREMALLFCEMGANVYITARREKHLHEVVDQCKRVGRTDATFGYVVADMANMEQAANVVLESAAHLGGIDYLILNHAYMDPVQRFYEMTDNEFEHFKTLMDVTFFSFVKMTQTAMPYLIKTNGSIAAVSSLVGEIPHPLLASYCFAKHAIVGFYGSLDLDFYIRSINVSSTLAIIGYVDTYALETLWKGLDKYGQGREVAVSLVNTRPPKEAAYSIIRSTALRESIMYFPNEFGVWGVNMVKKFFLSYFRDANKAVFDKTTND